MLIVQVLSDEVYHGSVEDELASECVRNRPSILKLQRYICIHMYTALGRDFCQGGQTRQLQSKEGARIVLVFLMNNIVLITCLY